MKARSRLSHAARACAVLALAAACRGDRTPPQQGPPPVLGRWHGAHDDLELFSGGRMLLHQGAYRVAGTYEFVEPRRMLLIYQNALAAVPPGDYRIALAGDSLTFCETDAPARCIRYVRAPDSGADAHPATAVDDGTVPRLAAPVRPDQFPPESRAREADGVLKQAYTLQQVYKAEYGHYAAHMDTLRVVGWEPPGLRWFTPPRVVRHDDDRLCIVVQPRTADLWPVHIDQTGTLGRGAECR